MPIVDLSSPSVVGHGRSWKPKWLRHVAFTVYYFSFPAFLKIASEGTSSVSLRASIRVPSGPPQAGMQAPPQAGKQAGRQAGWQAFFLSDVTEAGIAPAQQAGRQAGRRTGKHGDGSTWSRRDSAQEIYNDNVWILGNTHKNKSYNDDP